MSPAERKEEMEKEHFHPTPRGNFLPYVWLEWRGGGVSGGERKEAL